MIEDRVGTTASLCDASRIWESVLMQDICNICTHPYFTQIIILFSFTGNNKNAYFPDFFYKWIFLRVVTSNPNLHPLLHPLHLPRYLAKKGVNFPPSRD